MSQSGRNLHLEYENELAARLINSVKLDNLFGVGAEHQDGDFMLNLFDPATSSTSTSQELRCIVHARFLVCSSSHCSEVSPAKWKNGIIEN
jgi:hypothetical protein